MATASMNEKNFNLKKNIFGKRLTKNRQLFPISNLAIITAH
jgi:hypothetical protein